jgi:hypothetical protein
MLLAAAPAAAQKAPGPVQDIEDCRSIPDVPERVRCYDKAAAALAEARRKGEVVIVDRDEVRRTRRSLFGFDLPRLPFFEGDKSADEDAPKEVEGTIKALRFMPNDKWQVTLDSGAVWLTTEVAVRQGPPKLGEPVKIRKAAFGSYMLSVKGRRGVRAMRIR